MVMSLWIEYFDQDGDSDNRQGEEQAAADGSDGSQDDVSDL
jgi:hypothetical protein